MAVLSVDALPLGFRFRPTDVELVDHYLKRKINGGLESEVEVIPVIDVCKNEPWDLPGQSLIKTDDSEWFFFSPKRAKYPNGERSQRATDSGYWKPTGRDRSIKLPSRGTEIGKKKTLVYYSGRAPNGVRTNWVIHEYRKTGEQGAFVLCRLFRKHDNRTLHEVDEVESSALSPTVTRSSLEETPLEGDAIVESLTSLDQNVPQFEIQADSQNMHPTSNVQPTSTNMLLQDSSKGLSSYPLKLDENSCSTSDNPDNEFDGGAEIARLLDELAKQPSPELCILDLSNFDLINYPMDSCMESLKFDALHDRLQQGLSQNGNIEEDSATRFLDTIFCYPEDSQPEMSNAIVSEGEKSMASDNSVCNPVFSEESMAYNNEDIGATIGQESTGLLVRCESQMMKQSSYLSSNTGKETAHANLDNTGIQIRARQNSSPEIIVKHQCLTRRVRLQKPMCNVSVASTGNESITCSENVHKSIISEVRNSEKQLADKGTIYSVSSFGDNVGGTPESSIQSILCRGKSDIAGVSSVSSELSHELNSKLSLEKGWTPENVEKIKGPSSKSAYRTGSYSVITAVLLLTIFLLLFMMISWSIVH